MKEMNDGPKPSGITPEQLERVVEVMRELDAVRAENTKLREAAQQISMDRGVALVKLDVALLQIEELNKELDRTTKAWAEAADERDRKQGKLEAMTLQNGLLKKYAVLLGDEVESAVGMAHIHGWRSTDERIEEGKRLRKELGIARTTDLRQP